MQNAPGVAEPDTSYDPVFFPSLFAVEDRHFWFRARNQVIATVVQHLVAPLAPGYRMLEVGCGTGNTLRILERVCHPKSVFGMDLFREGLTFARQRVACPLIQGDMQAPPFHSQFAIVGLFDVLEHLPDDEQVLRDLQTMLAPNGILLLTVPAYPSLWSYFDEASCHYRRYQPQELTHKLTAAGYRIVYQTHYMASIFPLVWVGRRLAARTQHKHPTNRARAHDLARHDLRIVPVVNTILSWVLAQEARLIAQRRTIPIGTSLLAVARRDAHTKL